MTITLARVTTDEIETFVDAGTLADMILDRAEWRKWGYDGVIKVRL